ncbi:hypothetical protein Cal7507_1857 [Calothrix sp. PCC 7507]|nr:hypothetical protein Cal7507_1857 [Calothrix sp. PCC 7507]
MPTKMRMWWALPTLQILRFSQQSNQIPILVIWYQIHFSLFADNCSLISVS